VRCLVRVDDASTAQSVGVHAGVVKMWFRTFELVGCQLCEMHNNNYSSKKCGKSRSAA
jgi:hypothetical protein